MNYDIYKQYGLVSPIDYARTIKNMDKNVEPFIEIYNYLDFLNATDHIPNKIIESQVLGEKSIPDRHIEIIKLRKEAREYIDKFLAERK